MSDHSPGSELDLDAIEARARARQHRGEFGAATTLALVAEVRRLRAEVRDLQLRLAEEDDDWADPADYFIPGGDDAGVSR